MTTWQQLDKCKLELSLMQNIASMRDYAASWIRLARVYRDIGFGSNAEYCRERGLYYARIAHAEGGEYVRLFYGSLAELVEVAG
jgi:hypothetical protein